MPSSYSPNKNYQLMATGEDINTWGINLNANLSLIDENLGGTLSISVAGNSNINLSLTQAANLIHNLSGVLTGNINYNFPANGGFYAINNQTTGSFTVTVTVQGGTGGIIVPQGTITTVYIDATVPAVDSFTGTQYNYIGGTVTGTANALVISQTFPSSFSLQNGVLVTFTPTATNTGSTTVNVAGTGVIALKTPTLSGISDLAASDIVTGIPVIMQYNATSGYWLALNITIVGTLSTLSTNTAIGVGNGLNFYVATTALTLTIAQTTTLGSFWYIEINAQGGAVTITPNAADVINVNGLSLSAGTSFIIPGGASCKLETDGNGHLYINFLGSRLNQEVTLASGSTTSLGTVASNIINITGTTTITSFGSAASTFNPFYITRFTGVLTLTYNATSLIFPGATNYTTAAGDVFMWKYEGSGNWRCVGYALISGQSLVATTVPTATSSTLGIVKPDNSTITISGGILSAPGTYSKGTGLTLNPYATSASGSTAHGLGTTPNDLILYMECITNDNGYTVGQRVPMGGTGAAFQGATITVYVDSTNIYYATNTADLPDVVNPSTKARVAITAANWKVVMTPVIF